MALTRGTRTSHQLDAIMSRAAGLYECKGSVFTSLRRNVFEVIVGSETLVGAYDVVRELERRGMKASPVSVYRALNSLLAAGVIRQLRSSNSYIPSEAVLRRGGTSDLPTIFVVCEFCHCAAEISYPSACRPLIDAVANATFAVAPTYIEAAGICERCAARKTNRATVHSKRRRESEPLRVSAAKDEAAA